MKAGIIWRIRIFRNTREDGPSGHADYEGLSRHKNYVEGHFWNWPPIPRVTCNKLYAAEGRIAETGSKKTEQAVRFGLNAFMDLPTELDLTSMARRFL